MKLWRECILSWARTHVLSTVRPAGKNPTFRSEHSLVGPLVQAHRQPEDGLCGRLNHAHSFENRVRPLHQASRALGSGLLSLVL